MPDDLMVGFANCEVQMPKGMTEAHVNKVYEKDSSLSQSKVH